MVCRLGRITVPFAVPLSRRLATGWQLSPTGVTKNSTRSSSSTKSGLRVNLEKSKLMPIQSIDILGLILDTP